MDETIDLYEEIEEDEIELEEEPAIFGIFPTGTIDITENGTHNVKEYEYANVQTTPNLQNKIATITENTTIEITTDTGYDGMGKVTITTNVAPNLQDKSVSITENGTTIITKDVGYEGINEVIVTTDVPQSFNALMTAPESASTTSAYYFIKQINNIDISNVARYDYLFSQFRGLETISFSNTNDNVTNTQYMFQNCLKLAHPPLFNTEHCQYMTAMFNGCETLVEVPLYNTSSCENFSAMFYGCKNLEIVPQFDTSNAINMNTMFRNCPKLINIPLFNTSKVETMGNIFQTTNNLSDTSLNNVLLMCINAINYTNTKTLRALGITQSMTTRCQSLSNWQAFLNAGWTTGY